MKFKKIFIFLIVNLVVVLTLLAFRSSFYTSKAQPCNLITINDHIRVGISTNDFSRYEYKEVSITSNGKFEIINKFDNAVIAESQNNQVFDITMADNKFIINLEGKVIADNISGPLQVKSLDGSFLNIVNLKRKGKPALYRGEFEITKAPTQNNLLSVVNVLPLEEYLRGVVPNESSVSFGLEALKAQAVAARNYAVRPRIKAYKQFDICDSVACQVYYGKNTEESLSDKAVTDTKGLVGLYNDEIILALYSSTAGGYTESYENAFSDPLTNAFPSKPIPYLKGKPDVAGIPELNSEERARRFYASLPSTFDVNSGYYRWNRSWTREELEALLNKNLSKCRRTPLIFPQVQKNCEIGTLENIEVPSRGVSGKAMAVKITTTKGEWVIEKELLIRKIFESGGKMLPSANVFFDKTCDENGNIVKIEAFGGGLGHGVGMSQYGAGFMSKNGYSFDQILQHYYDGISIGTAPVLIDSKNDNIEQEFASPASKAQLVVYNYDNADSLCVKINSQYLTFPLEGKSGQLRYDLSNYIKDGTNTIVYSLPEYQNGKRVKAWVEVFIQNIN